MIEYQINAAGHRGTPAVKRLVEYAPASGGLALWMQHRDVDQPPARAQWSFGKKKRDWIIANDGETIYYGKAFESFSLPLQTGLVAHQILHVALRHVAREQSLRERLGSIDVELYCVCADAIVNTSLSHLNWIELPSDSIMLDKLLLHVLGIEEPLDVSLHKWSTESLYHAIDDRQWQGGSNAQSGSSSRQAQSGSSNQGDSNTIGSQKDNSQSQQSSSRSQQMAREQLSPEQHNASAPQNSEQQQATRDGPKSSAARQLAANMIRDLLVGSDNSPETQVEQSRQWSENLLRAHTADAEQSLMRQLLADNRPLKTPWEQVLRTRLQRALAQKTATSWSRPSRSWLANRGKTASGKRMPWQPGLAINRRSSRLCIMVDVSGSVDDSLMLRFANEIERIMRVLRSEVHLVIGDDKVHHQCKLQAGLKDLRDIKFAGGGGTDFAPLIDAADKLNPDIGVFLTDLEGPSGEAPAWPVIWALPESAALNEAPFGQCLILD